MAVDDFKFKLVGNFLGYNSQKDKTVIDAGYAVLGSQNIYKKLTGTWSVRPGLKHIDSVEPRDATEAAVLSDYVWGTSWGVEYPLRVANSKLQVLYRAVWYDLITSLTLTAFSFAKWWDATEKKDRLLMVNNDDDILHWSGGITTLASRTANTLTKNTALDGFASWAAAGFATNTGGEKKIKINGTEYTYTGGETTDTLTGVTPDPTGEAVGSICIQSVQTAATKPISGFKNTFIKVIDNQLYCLSYTSRSVYVSSQTDFTNFSAGTNPGDPFLKVLDSTPKAIEVRQGKPHIFAGVSDLFILTYTETLINNVVTRVIAVDKKKLANLQSCLGFEFIDSVGDTIVYLSQENQLLTYGDYRNYFQPVFPPLSLDVHDELQAVDFTGGQLRTIGDFTYIIAPNEGLVYLYQQRQYIDNQGTITIERIWHPPFIWNISRVCIIGGVIYGYSNANPQLYQLWDTLQWSDDTPNIGSDGEYEKIAYTSALKLAYQNGGIRTGIISIDKIYYEGYATTGTKINGKANFEYQGSESAANFVITESGNQAFFMTGMSSFSMGDSSLGDNPLGEGLTTLTDQELLPKFKAIVGVQPMNCSEYQFELYSDQKDSRWELLAIGSNPHMAEEEAPVKFIKK